MKYNPEIHRRRSIRLKAYDYSSPGAYFVTICTYNKNLFFEDHELAKIAREVWDTIPQHHPTVHIDEFVVMPNHVHGILWLSNVRRGRMHPALSKDAVSLPEGAMHGAPTVTNRRSLSTIIQNFKAEVKRRIRRNTQVYFAWQRNYYERVIRNEIELNQVRQYIQDNPLNWETDEENPKRQQR